jgi:hypothetical protein
MVGMLTCPPSWSFITPMQLMYTLNRPLQAGAWLENSTIDNGRFNRGSRQSGFMSSLCCCIVVVNQLLRLDGFTDVFTSLCSVSNIAAWWPLTGLRLDFASLSLVSHWHHLAPPVIFLWLSQAYFWPSKAHFWSSKAYSWRSLTCHWNGPYYGIRIITF